MTKLPFWFGTAAGLFPWPAIAYNLVAADSVPGFVYGVFVSLFVLLQFRAEPVAPAHGGRTVVKLRVGEKAYLALSLVAKSALAWQIFAGPLAG